MTKRPSANVRDDACPCGSGLAYARCCEPCHCGTAAATAEALMRSRYSAYVLNLHDYLRDTWHPDTRPAEFDDAPLHWLGLDVKRHLQQDDTHAIVEFVARYRADGRGHRLHETSRFVRENGRWYYVDGDFAAA
ncbi:MAG: hypothetical protein E6R10_09690 [Rhodocyclaceae bacterium]|nr:MAG: hypothetical protein E6R10_09690 [Rhodocyclaceae bacterium]